MPDLDSLVKEHYSRVHLPEARMQEILDRTPRRTTSVFVWYVRMSAVAVSLVGGFVILHAQLSERALAIRALDEIAMNHEKQLEVEVAAGDFTTVTLALHRLDFPLQPESDRLAGFELVGGRYCSILGGLAAQLRLRHRDTGLLHTLYATLLTPDLRTIGSGTRNHGNLNIALWRENNVFFGLAGPGADGAVDPP